MDIALKVPALEKLLDYTASGIGSIAGTIIAPMRARQEAKAKVIAAEGDANVLLIMADAQAKARAVVLPGQDAKVVGTLDIANVISQRIQFQEQKRQANIESVVRHAAQQLENKSVAASEPDHDWTARFFGEVQDVSSEEMQLLWARVLAGQVEREGSTSVRTLHVLRNLDRATARLFRTFCSMCVFFPSGGAACMDGRVPSLGGNAADNALAKYRLNFGALNQLNEHDIIIPDYNSWLDYQICTGGMPFRFQDQDWDLVPLQVGNPRRQFKLFGVSLTQSGMELSRVVGTLEAADQFTEDLRGFFHRNKLDMKEWRRD